MAEIQQATTKMVKEAVDVAYAGDKKVMIKDDVEPQSEKENSD